MRRINLGLFVFAYFFSILLASQLSWAQTPPSLLVVVRAGDDSLWKMTCDDLTCTSFSSFPGMFRTQPAVTWDETAQEWVVAGTAADYSIWMATFDKNGTFNNDWQRVPGATPSPAGVSGGPRKAATITVNCPGQSLQAAVNAAQTGDTINVTGTCSENVIIQEEKQRLTLDGQNAATLNGPSTGATLTVRGKGILIQNFEITGGLVGVWVERSSTAVINHNNIHDAVYHGIYIADASFAAIKNNNIHNNPEDGIRVDNSSTARIGAESPGDTIASPNTIQTNGKRGIRVMRTSNARIVSNTISGNTKAGIWITRVSQADIVGNTINSNGEHGIVVDRNSGVELGEDSPATIWDQPNITTANNTGYGILCTLGAVVRGHIGSSNQINGNSGQSSTDSTCTNQLQLLTP